MSIGPITAAVMVFLAVVSTTTAHSIVQHQVTVSQPHCTDPFDCIAPTSPRGLHQPRHDICTCRTASVLSAGRCHAKAVDDSLRASQLFINYGILSTLSVRDEFGLKLTSSSPCQSQSTSAMLLHWQFRLHGRCERVHMCDLRLCILWCNVQQWLYRLQCSKRQL